MILSRCSSYAAADGSVQPLSRSGAVYKSILSTLKSMSTKSLRTVALCHAVQRNTTKSIDKQNPQDFEQDLILDAIFGIRDPVREDVPDAVATCQRAGITVRMVTGDNIETAKAIARECGILTDDGVCMEGPEFRKLTPAGLDKILPKLQV